MSCALGLVLVASLGFVQASEPYVLEDADVWGSGPLAGPMPAVRPGPPPAPIRPAEWLVRHGGAEEARSVAREFLLDRVAGPRAEPGAEWERVVDTAALRHVAAAFARVAIERAEVRMARLSGARVLLVNGEAFCGDPERRGDGGVPVALRAGANELLVVDAPSGFELELWSPRTRVVIADWDVRLPQVTRDTACWIWGTVGMTVFNASPAPIDLLEFHYGFAVPEQDGLRPRLERGEIYGGIPPLGMESVGADFISSDRELPATTEARFALYPVCVFARGDVDADRRILRVPLSEPGTPRATRAREALDGAGGAGELFRRARRLVYGTAGTDDEDAALLARARFDQQRIWYATGCMPELYPDRLVMTELEVRGGPKIRAADLPPSRREGCILYGNADTNAAWERMLGAPGDLDARRGRIRLGQTERTDDGLFGFAIVPRAGAAAEGTRVLVLFDSGARGSRALCALDPFALAPEDEHALVDASDPP